MLNQESRKYFDRALPLSGSVYNYFALDKGNHVARMQECAAIADLDKIIDYLKTANTDVLAQCYFDRLRNTIKSKWAPTIENAEAVAAFLTETPDEIYNSGKVAAMDTLFAFNSQVIEIIECEKIIFYAAAKLHSAKKKAISKK